MRTYVHTYIHTHIHIQYICIQYIYAYIQYRYTPETPWPHGDGLLVAGLFFTDYPPSWEKTPVRRVSAWPPQYRPTPRSPAPHDPTNDTSIFKWGQITSSGVRLRTSIGVRLLQVGSDYVLQVGSDYFKWGQITSSGVRF